MTLVVLASTSNLMNNTPKTGGIKEIARALGISIGTVDRVLHNRPGVSLKTKARVLDMAEQIGYKPNLAAVASIDIGFDFGRSDRFVDERLFGQGRFVGAERA